MGDGMSSFWSPVTSATKCCEKNSAHSSYIAEFYDTISNIPCILMVLIGLINALRQWLRRALLFFTYLTWYLLLEACFFTPHCNVCNSRVMRPLMVWEMLLLCLSSIL